MDTGNLFVYLVVSVLFLFSLGSFLQVTEEQALDFTYQTEVPVTDNWVVDSEQEWIDNEDDSLNIEYSSSQGGYMYIQRDSEGFWLGSQNIEQEETGTPVELNYQADMDTGNGNYTVRVVGDEEEILETETNELITGTEQDFLFFDDYEDVERIELEFELEETGDEQNNRPRINNFDLEYETEQEQRTLGMEEETVNLFLYLLFLGGIALFIASSMKI